MKEKENNLNEYSQKRIKLSDLRVFLILCSLGFVLYFYTINYPFHFDDQPGIVLNNNLISFDKIDELWRYSPARFFCNLTFFVNYQISGLETWSYHLFNILTHILNGFLVFIFIRYSLVKSNEISEKIYLTNDNILWISLFTAILFIIHPIQTESVTYIIQRFESFSTLLILLSFTLYIKARNTYFENQNNQIDKSFFNKRYFKIYIFSLIIAIFASLSKETAFGLPILLLIYDFFFYNNPKLALKKRLLYFLPFIFVMILPPISILMLLTLEPNAIINFKTDYSSFQYFSTQLNVVLYYIKLIFLPINQNFDYSLDISKNILNISSVISGIILIAITFLGIIYYKKNRMISFFIFLFFIILAPTSSFVPIQDIIYEHRLYLPILSVIFLLVYYLNWLFNINRKNHKAFAGILTTIIIILSVLTISRNLLYSSKVTFWEDIVINNKSKNKVRPYYNLANVYHKEASVFLAEGNTEKYFNYLDNAIKYYKISLLKKKLVVTYYNLASIYNTKRDYKKAEDYLLEAIRFDEKYIDSYISLAEMYLNFKDYKKANNIIENGLLVCEKNRKLISNVMRDGYSNLMVEKARYYEAIKNLNDALGWYNKALKVNKYILNLYITIGETYEKLNQIDNAVNIYKTGIKIAIDGNIDIPNEHLAGLYNNLGIIYVNLKQFLYAEEYFKKAIETNPNKDMFYFNLGALYGQNIKYDEAIKSFEELLNLKGIKNSSYYIPTLQNLVYLYKAIKKNDEKAEYYLKLLNSK